MKKQYISYKAFLVFFAFLTGCDWMGKDPAPPLPGERIPVMLYDSTLKASEILKDVPVVFPFPEKNKGWLQAGGVSSHAMPPLALGETLKIKANFSIGEGSSKRVRLLIEPIASSTHIFTMDTHYQVSCFDQTTQERIWRVTVSDENHSGVALGGGLALDGDVLLVTTSMGDTLALDAATGNEKWRTSLSVPVRAAPMLAEGLVFVITMNNTLEVMSQETGERIWSHTGVAEIASILGSSNPAYERDIVVTPYSSGEIVALNAQTGMLLWLENLANMRQRDGLMGIAHVRARPVIEEGRVYALSHSGRMLSLDLETGERLWEQEIGGLYAPAIGGDFLFVVTYGGQLIALQKQTGKIKWVTNLSEAFHKMKEEDKETETKEIHWVGPILGGGNIIVAGSQGDVLRVSPETGQLISYFNIGEKIFMTPIIVNEQLILLGDEGNLHIYE